jgi:hypothetical protein
MSDFPVEQLMALSHRQSHSIKAISSQQQE